MVRDIAIDKHVSVDHLYFGCVFPDLDVYVEAVVYVIDQSVADRYHRTYLHSIISALFLLLLFTMCHKIYSFYLERKRFKRKMNDQTEAERAYLLPGERASEIKHGSHIQDSMSGKTAQFEPQAFGLGLFLGICSHCLLDIFFWFASIDIIWPLPLITNGRVEVIALWKHIKVPPLVNAGLDITEMMFAGLTFTAIRSRIPEDDFTAETGLIPKVLLIEILHFGYFSIMILVYIFLAVYDPLLETYVFFLMTFIPLLFITVPSFYYLSWKARRYLLLPYDYEKGFVVHK